MNKACSDNKLQFTIMITTYSSPNSFECNNYNYALITYPGFVPV